MLEARTVMLGATGAGAVLGALFALTIPTTMKAGPEPTWRDSIPRHEYPTESYRFVDSGPIDPGPRRWLDPPIPEYEPPPTYAVPDYTAELRAVMADAPTYDASANLAAAEAAETAILARQEEASMPATPPETRQPEPETPSVQSQPAVVITLPDEPRTTL